MRLIAFCVLALASLVAHAQTLDQCIAQWGYSVPKVSATSNGWEWSNGSGVYLGRLWVLTAQHVVEGSSQIHCDFQGRKITVKDHVFSRNSDQALLKLASDPGVRAVPLVIQRTPSVTFAGYDHGRRLRFFTGSKSATFQSGNVEYSGQHAGSISGDSGGPAFGDGGVVANLWGGWGNSGGRGTVASSNAHTIDFVRRAAQKFPDLAPLVPSVGGISSPAPSIPISTPTAPAGGCVNGQCAPAAPATPTIPVTPAVGNVINPPTGDGLEFSLPLTVTVKLNPEIGVNVGAVSIR